MGSENKSIESTSLGDFVDRLGFGAGLEEIPADKQALLRGAAMGLAAREFSGQREEILALRNPAELAVVVAALRLRVNRLLDENRPLLELSRTGATRALVGLLSTAQGEARALLDALAHLEPGAVRQELISRVEEYAAELGRWMPDVGAVTVEETVKIREAKRLAERARESERGRNVGGSSRSSSGPSLFGAENINPRTLALTAVFVLLCLVFLATSSTLFGNKVDPEVQALTETVRQELPSLRQVLSTESSLILITDDWRTPSSERQRRSQVSGLLARGVGEYDELIVTSESGMLLGFWAKSPDGNWLPNQ